MPSRSHNSIAGAATGEERNGRRLWEQVVLGHLGVLIVGTSWAFGGQAPWVRDALLAWTTLGMLLFFLYRGSSAASAVKGEGTAWTHLWPLVVLDALVLAGGFNPSTRVVVHEGSQMFAHITPRWDWLPSSARPDLAWRELWLLNGIVLSCYNAFQVLRSRRTLRRLLVVAAGNGLLLAVFGTFQKLMQAPGLYFGIVDSPNQFFFASFIYHNHWGAFTLLNAAAALGLLLHAQRRGGHRDGWHSPMLAGAVGILLLAASIPLSGSRSCSVLVFLFLLGAAVRFLTRLIRRRRMHHESALLPVLGVLAAGGAALLLVYLLGRDVIEHRSRQTLRQIEAAQGEVSLNSRLRLYRDTWRMGAEKPVFGWGLESYATVFMVYNSAPTPLRGGWKPFYAEAHNDWLQTFAELGLAGSAALTGLILLPLWRVGWRKVASPVPLCLLAGCGLLLLYAWVEFPFANPSVLIGFWGSLFAAARYARLDLAAEAASR